MKKHFTTTVYIFHEDKVLLHKHAKLGKWLPPGGHLETNETPAEAARREVFEESGLEIEFLEQGPLEISNNSAFSFEKPFLCLLENMPRYKDEPAHQHIDFIYLAKPISLKEDLKDFQWFEYQTLKDLDIFPETIEIFRYYFGFVHFLDEDAERGKIQSNEYQSQ